MGLLRHGRPTAFGGLIGVQEAGFPANGATADGTKRELTGFRLMATTCKFATVKMARSRTQLQVIAGHVNSPAR